MTVCCRPQLEALDERIVPTANNWVGGVSSDASVAANWSLNHVPIVGEDVLFVPYVVPLSPPTSVDCTNFSGPAGGGKYNSVFFDGGYTAKVTLSQGFDTKALHVNNGTLDQPDLSQDKTDITVTGGPMVDSYNEYYLNGAPDFKWTGGTLNSTSHAAELILQGTGRIAPVNAGTVNTADAISVVAGAILTFMDGTVNFTNVNSTGIEAAGTVKLESGDNGVILGYSGTATNEMVKISVPAGGKLEAYRAVEVTGFVSDTSQLPIVVTGGTFTVGDEVQLTVTGRVGGTQGANVSVQDGITRLTAGSYLVVPNGMGVSGGTLTTINASASRTSYITGDLLVSGGNVMIDEGREQGHLFGNLAVTGNITWIDGVFRPFVNGATGSTEADWWGCSGTFTIYAAGAQWDGNGFAANAGARVGPPGIINLSGNPQGRSWLILAALQGIQLQQGSPDLSFETQAEAGVWKMDTINPTYWKLERTQN